MELLLLDGSHGEGGGQILRTALSLSVIAGRAFRLVNIRAGRSCSGLLPQHLSAVRAAAAISGATMSGDRLGSTDLVFSPQHPPKHGRYVFDVAETAGRGSAGSVSLVLQTILVPLALAGRPSTLVLRGGTHVEWSPPFDYVAACYLPALRRIGLHADVELTRWGWYPVGGGEVVCDIAAPASGRGARRLRPLEAIGRGALRRIAGRAVAANLPAHIPQRMADRARACLGDLGMPVDIQPLRVAAPCAGAGVFFAATYENLAAAFSAYGRPGKASEAVADEAVAAFREHHLSTAAVELHLADQLLLPLALADGPSSFTAPRPTKHLQTNAWTIGRFGIAEISIEEGAACRIRIAPHGSFGAGPNGTA